MPAASSAPGSHLPPKKKKHKWHPPKGVGSAIGGAGSTATKTGGGKKKKHKGKPEAEAVKAAHEAVKQANKAIKSAQKISTNPYYGLKASGDVKTTEEKRQLREVRKLNKEYEDKSTLSKVLLPPPGVSAGDAPFIGKIGSPSNVVSAIKGIVTGSGKKAAVSGTAKALPKAAAKGSAVPAKGEQAAAKLEKAVAKAARPGPAARAAKAAKAAPKATAKNVGKKIRYATRPKGWEVASKAGRAAKYRRLGNKGTWLVGSAGGSAVAGGGALVKNTVDATFEDGGVNLQPLHTTARTLKALPGALAADVAAVATGHPDKVVDETKALYEAYAKLMGTDAETAKKVVNDELGYVPILTGALGLARTSRELFPTTSPTKLPVRTTRAIAKAEKEGRDVVTGPHLSEGVVREAKDRSRTAQIFAAAEPRAKASMAKNVKDIGTKNLRKLHRAKVGKKGVRGKDVIAFVADTGTPRNSAEGAAFIRDYVLPSIDAGRRPNIKSEFTPSDIANAILENPQILDNPALKAAVGDRAGTAGLGRAQATVDARIAQKETGGRTDLPNPESGAADVTQARVLGVPTREERIPTSVRDLKNAKGEPMLKAKPGRNAAKYIKGEARQRLNRAKRLEAQAVALKQTNLDRSMILEWRAKQYRAQAEALKASVSKWDMAAGMEKVAARLREGKNVPKQYRDLSPDELVAAADKLKADAEALRRDALSDSQTIASEVGADLQKAREATGLNPEEPIFVKHQSVEDVIPLKGSTDVPWTAGQGGAKAKLREGKLWEGDAARLGGDATIQNMMRTELALSKETATREFYNEFLYRPEGSNKPLITTDKIAKQMKQDGTYPPGYVWVDLHEIKGPFRKGMWNEAAGLIDSPVHAAIRDAVALEGRKGGFVPKAAWQEFKAQSERLNVALRAIGKVTRGAAIALLGYNPLWFIYQLGASPLALWASHPNMLRWVKAASDVYRAHKGDSTREWENFQAKYGATSSEQFNMRDFDNVGMSPNEVKNFKAAAKTARMTWAGKALQVLKEGPFVIGNRKYEGWVRDIGAMLEMDRMIRESRHPQFHRYSHSVADLHESVWAQIKQMDSMTPTQRVKFLNSEKGQFAAREMQRRVDDAIGNWNALTHTERQAAAVLMFMPFLRFSLRWTFYAFPKNRPLTMAAALNASQANAMEVDRLTQEGSNAKGPGWESGYGQVPITDTFGLDLNRLNPASNAVTDILSGDRGPLQSALAPFTPAAGIVGSALAGQDPFTGEPTDKSIAANIGEGVANLVTPARGPLEQLQGGPSVWSTLLRKVRGQPTSPLGKTLVPTAFYDPQREAEAQHIQQDLMAKAFGPIPSPQDPTKELSKSDIKLWYDPQERLNLIRAWNEKVRAQRELWAQLDKWGLEPPYKLTSSTIEWPVGGENKTTKEPPRAVYIDPKKKKRWTAAGKDQPDSGTGYEQYLQNTTSNSYEDYMQDSGTKSYDEYLSK